MISYNWRQCPSCSAAMGLLLYLKLSSVEKLEDISDKLLDTAQKTEPKPIRPVSYNKKHSPSFKIKPKAPNDILTLNGHISPESWMVVIMEHCWLIYCIKFRDPSFIIFLRQSETLP